MRCELDKVRRADEAVMGFSQVRERERVCVCNVIGMKDINLVESG